MDIARHNPRSIGLDQKAANTVCVISFGLAFQLGPDHSYIGDGSRRDPHFLAVEDVLIACLACVRGHARGVRAEPRLGEAEAANLLALCEHRKPRAFLFFRAESEDGIHDQRRLHADETAQAAVAALQLLHSQAILDVRHAGAAVAMEISSVKSQVAQYGDELARKARLAKATLDDGNHSILYKIAGSAANEDLLLAQICVKLKKIEALKLKRHLRRYPNPSVQPMMPGECRPPKLLWPKAVFDKSYN